MEVNLLGPVAAVTAFISVWGGHVSVRKIEARTVKLWKPMLAYFLLGTTLLTASLFASNRPVSMVSAMVGITLLWDVLELRRQEKRIWKGHATANPNNPRHQAILAKQRSTAMPPGIDPAVSKEAISEAGRPAGRQEA
jgi:Domain of unknown function (DUF4491)